LDWAAIVSAEQNRVIQEIRGLVPGALCSVLSAWCSIGEQRQ